MQKIFIDTKTLESDLRNAIKQHASKPEWNPDKKIWADAIVRIEQDIADLKAGREMTSVKNWRMPEWGTRGS